MPMFKKSMVVLVLLVLAAAGGALYSFSVEDTAVRLEESALPVPSVAVSYTPLTLPTILRV